MSLQRHSLTTLIASAALCLTLLAPTSNVVAAPAQQAIPSGDAAGNEWLTYGGNFFNQRYSSLNQITTSNVAQLKGAWTYHIGAFSDAAIPKASTVRVSRGSIIPSSQRRAVL